MNVDSRDEEILPISPLPLVNPTIKNTSLRDDYKVFVKSTNSSVSLSPRFNGGFNQNPVEDWSHMAYNESNNSFKAPSFGRGRSRTQCQLCERLGHLVANCWHHFDKIYFTN